MTLTTIKERPDLPKITGTWRWEAFFRHNGRTLADVIELDVQCACGEDLMPTVLVLLEEAVPVGMVALCLDDLEGRPEFNPWLAGLYIDPQYRGKGYAVRLIRELEAFARKSEIGSLYLYTASANGLYAQEVWESIETFDLNGQAFSIMQKDLQEGP